MRATAYATTVKVPFQRAFFFSKRYGPVPEPDKEIARERWADFKKRLDGGTRKPPSPIGGKAPPKKRSS